MRRITIWLASTAAILVLLFSYKTSTSSAGNAPSVAVGSGGVGTSADSGTSSGSGSASDPTSVPSPTATSGASASTPKKSTTPSASSSAAAGSTAVKTVTGNSVDTRWGPVQVTITVSGNKITKVAVPVYPNNNFRDQEINNFALPQLVQETMSAQSAKINVVSGASVTSGGYISSLQSALDKAGI